MASRSVPVKEDGTLEEIRAEMVANVWKVMAADGSPSRTATP
jgi:hypothetical protein